MNSWIHLVDQMQALMPGNSFVTRPNISFCRFSRTGKNGGKMTRENQVLSMARMIPFSFRLYMRQRIVVSFTSGSSSRKNS
ncbi:MAG: hypothetical protein NTV01_21120 [Bacteroidia bacterium]|nr:hypothetical protein [Bacteroidia bacterium]